MKIDLHVHSSERSGCARDTEDEMIKSAVAFGLDGLFFTDHKRHISGERLLELNTRHAPFKIFRGIELHVKEQDIVVLGLASPELEEDENWDYASLRAFVLERGGFMILAHPFRYRPVPDEFFVNPPDAVEIKSKNIIPENESLITEAARRMRRPLVCVSDAHASEDVGLYHIETPGAASSEEDVLSSLRSGSYECREDSLRIRRQAEEKVLTGRDG